MYSVGYNDILDHIHCNHPGNVFDIEQTMLKFQYLSSSLTLRRHCYFVPRPTDKSACWKTIFFISHPKHTLWVVKRTVSVRRFFWAPKHMFKLTGKKIITILRSWNILTWIYDSITSHIQILIIWKLANLNCISDTMESENNAFLWTILITFPRTHKTYVFGAKRNVHLGTTELEN